MRAATGADPDALETCLRDAYQQRRLQLDIHRSIFVGPAIPHPFHLKCQDTAATQVGNRRVSATSGAGC